MAGDTALGLGCERSYTTRQRRTSAIPSRSENGSGGSPGPGTHRRIFIGRHLATGDHRCPHQITPQYGREAIGFILTRGRAGFEGFTREEQSLGLFEMAAAAANAVFDAAANEKDAG